MDLETPEDEDFQLIDDEQIYNYHNQRPVIGTGPTVDAPDRKIFKIKGGRQVLHIHGRKCFTLSLHMTSASRPADLDLAIVAAASWTLHVHRYRTTN